MEGSVSTKVYLNHRKSVERCIHEGIFRQIDVDLATQVLWTMNHGITSLLITNPNFPWVDKEKLINQSIESAIEGFKA